MRIMIVVYSQTGHTNGVAVQLCEALIKDGHQVEIGKIEAIRDVKNANKVVSLPSFPSIENYQGIIFATFVEGFSLCPVMQEYILQLHTLKDKTLAGFVTEFFPYPWMGGNRAIKQMKALCAKKDNTLDKVAVLNRKNRKYSMMIENLILNFVDYFHQK